mgnify:CR=1 FL=1
MHASDGVDDEVVRGNAYCSIHECGGLVCDRVKEFGVAHDPCLLEESDAVVHADTTLDHGVDELVCLVHAVNLVEALELLAAVSECLFVSVHSVEV